MCSRSCHLCSRVSEYLSLFECAANVCCCSKWRLCFRVSEYLSLFEHAAHMINLPQPKRYNIPTSRQEPRTKPNSTFLNKCLLVAKKFSLYYIGGWEFVLGIRVENQALWITVCNYSCIYNSVIIAVTIIPLELYAIYDCVCPKSYPAPRTALISTSVAKSWCRCAMSEKSRRCIIVRGVASMDGSVE